MRLPRLSWRRALPPLVAAGIAAGIGLALPHLAEADPDALWHIVNDRCRPNQETAQSPRPCAEVTAVGGNLRDGYAILKDRCGATQYLLIATRRIGGIESPELAEAPNYFLHAWQARSYTIQRADRQVTPDEIGLTMNSPGGRSQSQLHIHIDLIRPDVRAALKAHAKDKLGTWSDVTLAGKPYRVMRVKDLATSNPAKMLAARLAKTGGAMKDQTLAVIGATFADGKTGFYILSNDSPQAHSEELQIDHSDCHFGTT
ncbi:MAG: CDP-diacylglycerol diphosphatase [Dongiaceae bacterium]